MTRLATSSKRGWIPGVVNRLTGSMYGVGQSENVEILLRLSNTLNRSRPASLFGVRGGDDNI